MPLSKYHIYFSGVLKGVKNGHEGSDNNIVELRGFWNDTFNLSIILTLISFIRIFKSTLVTSEYSPTSLHVYVYNKLFNPNHDF